MNLKTLMFVAVILVLSSSVLASGWDYSNKGYSSFVKTNFYSGYEDHSMHPGHPEHHQYDSGSGYSSGYQQPPITIYYPQNEKRYNNYIYAPKVEYSGYSEYGYSSFDDEDHSMHSGHPEHHFIDNSDGHYQSYDEYYSGFEGYNYPMAEHIFIYEGPNGVEYPVETDRDALGGVIPLRDDSRFFESQNARIDSRTQVDSNVRIGNDVVVVEARDDGYFPNMINIRKGDTVRWINTGRNENWPASDPHPFHTNYPGYDVNKCGTSRQNQIFDACRPLAPGESYDFIFNELGTWGYHDHMTANQAIVIVG